jgi:hypothetical protein
VNPSDNAPSLPVCLPDCFDGGREPEWGHVDDCPLSELSRLRAIEAAAKDVLSAFDARNDEMNWTGPMVHTVLRKALGVAGDGCTHESVDTFASGAGRRVDVCMGCDRALRFWTE